MPNAPTPLQAETSRRNGARSRGPTSDAGKAAAARNATRHGIGASVLLLEPAELAFLADLRGALLELHEPCNAAEMAVVHELALLEVRRRRLDALELRVLSVLDGPTLDDDRLPGLATLLRYRQRLAAEETAAHARIDELRRYRELLGQRQARGLVAPDLARTHQPEIVDPRADDAVANEPATNEPDAGEAFASRPETDEVAVRTPATNDPERRPNRAERRRQEASARKGLRLVA